MARRSKEGWKTSWWKRVEGKSTQQRGMAEAAENDKELSHSAHGNELLLLLLLLLLLAFCILNELYTEQELFL